MLLTLSQLSLLPPRPPPTMAAASGDSSFDALAALVSSEGGFVGPICCRSHNGLRGLFVTEPVVAGDPLCAVPRACTLHARAADGLKPNERLMLALLEAKASSQHALYLATMPEHISLLRDWSAAELARLQSPPLAAAVASQRAWADATFARVAPLCRALRLALPAASNPARSPGRRHTAASSLRLTCAALCFAAAGVTRAELEWAERVVRSRALASVSPEGAPTLQLARRRRLQPTAPRGCEGGLGPTLLLLLPAAVVGAGASLRHVQSPGGGGAGAARHASRDDHLGRDGGALRHRGPRGGGRGAAAAP